MPSVTRVGDGTTGICTAGCKHCPHSRSGTNGSGSSNVFVNGIALHRQGDSGPCNCPHGGSYRSTAGSSSVFCNSKPVTRTSDSTTCSSCGAPGHHTAGSSNVFAGG